MGDIMREVKLSTIVSVFTVIAGLLAMATYDNTLAKSSDLKEHTRAQERRFNKIESSIEGLSKSQQRTNREQIERLRDDILRIESIPKKDRKALDEAMRNRYKSRLKDYESRKND
jgi:hypothetical protein